ncbi:thap domain protein [Anaeramoeba flamelloides]|uniref:Thap domain protein n=1 Tax=Anaeramoeba flamelloides TaxID=1746091 RepID=A0AAV7YE46_9EUKA|nr:thap domain protein [Anaeramoeba flamelloides]
MTLMWLHLSLPYRVLVFFFSVLNSTVSREVIHVIGVLNRKLENVIKWPNKKEIQIKIKKWGYKGHLNDENVWNLDNLQQKLGPNNLLLTDGGFYGPLVTKPIRKPWINKDQFNDAKKYNTLHSRSRAVVECAFAVLKAWKIATHSNFLTPGNHILAIDTCAKLCNWTRRLYRVNKIQTTYSQFRF